MISGPFALVCRVLHARYFRDGDFLSATLEYNPRYTWTKIMAAQPLVQRGVRWKVVMGEDISVWHDL